MMSENKKPDFDLSEYDLSDYEDSFGNLKATNDPPAQVQKQVHQQQQQKQIESLDPIHQKLDTILNHVNTVTPKHIRDLEELERIIIPILMKLSDPNTKDKKYLHWPDRHEIIQKKIQKILEITRPE